MTADDTQTLTDYITIYAAGDINGDLALDAVDITAIEMIAALINPVTFTSDVNDDGSVNILDITSTEIAVT